MSEDKNILLLSTSTVHGKPYLEYAREIIEAHFAGIRELIFIPYARPGLVSHREYTEKARNFFETLNIGVTGLHDFEDPVTALTQAEGVFTGGGNTFVLLKTLQNLQLLPVLRTRISKGMPYMGASAGTNLAGLTIGTTNDMPVVCPKDHQAIGAVPFNINPHYLDPDPHSTHMGETRETRIQEFHGYNLQPVIGLREGSWLRLQKGNLTLGGTHTARLFRRNMKPMEVETGTDLRFLLQ